MTLSRRILLKTCILSTAVLALGKHFAEALDFSDVNLRVATYRGDSHTVLSAARLDATPYKLSFAEFAAGNLIVEAMNAGALDVGSWSEIPLVFAAASNADIRVIAVLKGDVNLQAVLVPKTSTAKSIADLKGKRVGYVRATTSHFFLIKMLQEAGLSFADIQAISLSPTDGQAAFASGALDGWAIYGYAIPFLIEQNGARVLKTAKGILSGNYHIGVRRDLLKDEALKAAIADYLVRLANAYHWIDAHHTQWAKILSPIINVPEPLILSTLSQQTQPAQLVGVDQAAITSAQKVADTFADAKLMSKVGVAPWFDTSFNSSITSQ